MFCLRSALLPFGPLIGLNGLEPSASKYLLTKRRDAGVIPLGMMPPRETTHFNISIYIQLYIHAIHIRQGEEGKEGNEMVGSMGLTSRNPTPRS